MTPAIEARAEAAAEAAAARVAEGLREPGVRVTVSGGEVTIEGRGLTRRALTEPALRWPAETVR